ncbi:hypothetical protein Niako_2144 [Niastella koreensis GR20-10]|uniref:DUF4239 domain-containing protein n=2 Tax=Niastella koreensis TaxID=354356 RepID=G8TGQ7_NIAKG|nr:hypothetical protein [Niastella koreensis]AEV98499.1 hypothetical protein Niako_2144 [Niastella koreensis GR20-10]
MKSSEGNIVFPKRNFQIGVFLGTLSTWGLFALIVISSIVIISFGAWIGHLRFLNNIKDSESQLSTAVGSVLGLLGFMLGFTFSLTWSRFGNRNGLVSLQAKAIGVCYLRTSLLPVKQKTELRKLFYEYISVLLGMQTSGNVDKTLTRLEELHILIWNQTASLVQEEMDSEMRSLFTNAVNDLISLYLDRKTVALVHRIPDVIWSRLLLLAGIGMFAYGYQIGNMNMIRLFQSLLVPVAFGMIVVLIVDLDTTLKQRRFKVTKQPLMDVLEMMKKEIV